MPKTKSAWSYYYFSIAFAILAVCAGGIIGGIQVAISVLFLTVLETSLSLDNAAVNAKILENWDERWRKVFLFWGILVAVFFMRIVFPLAIVAIIAGIGPISVVHLALDQPEEYSRLLKTAHAQVNGFGSAFLLMLVLNFFFSAKHVYWLEWAETKLTRFGQIEGVAAAIVIGIMALMVPHVAEGKGQAFFFAGMIGIATYVITHGMASLMGGDEEEDDDAAAPATGNIGHTIIRQGLMGFLYIEVLDASFSFDGVIGAFAISNYLPVITLGLAAGAFFVRSFTIHMVDKGVMAEYRYLEHGAFYAILVLAIIMLINVTGREIPEWITGTVGALVLGAAFWHSVIVNKREAANEQVAIA
jgi:hypothetical protein